MVVDTSLRSLRTKGSFGCSVVKKKGAKMVGFKAVSVGKGPDRKEKHRTGRIGGLRGRASEERGRLGGHLFRGGWCGWAHV